MNTIKCDECGKEWLIAHWTLDTECPRCGTYYEVEDD